MNFKLTKSSLNFKVYTSPTIPSSGTENDIVIISTTPMENWILSSDAPVGEPRNRGDVWIQYSVSGNVFDIMNQHDFMLAITKIYQYVGRTWVSVNARRYVGGVWDVVSSAFSATISITYPANSTCTVTNPSGQIVANDTNTTSSPKTFTAIVGAKGTYTVTATATDGSGKSKSQDVSIESDGQSVSVSLSYSYYLIKDGVTETTFIKNGEGNIISDTSNGYIEVRAANRYPGKTVYYSTVVDISEYDTLYIDGLGYVPSTNVSASVRVGDNYESRTGIVNLNQSRSVVSIPLEGIKVDITSVYATIAANSQIYNETHGLYHTAASCVYNMWLE